MSEVWECLAKTYCLSDLDIYIFKLFFYFCRPLIPSRRNGARASQVNAILSLFPLNELLAQDGDKRITWNTNSWRHASRVFLFDQ